jgi:hypothetical protein
MADGRPYSYIIYNYKPLMLVVENFLTKFPTIHSKRNRYVLEAADMTTSSTFE